MRNHRRQEEPERDNSERWLLTYSDMITLLLALFIILYSMSNTDLQKFKALAREMGAAFRGNVEDLRFPGGSSELPTDADEGIPSDETAKQFDKVYIMLQKTVNAKGYKDSISLEKTDSYIIIRFNEGVLFYPDSYRMTGSGKDILKAISESLQTINPYIHKLQINGHTAYTGNRSTTSFFAWQLSADRAIAVLKYLVQQSNLEQHKMFIAGYSHHHPISDNSTEEGRSRNRRVEILVSPVEDADIGQIKSTAENS